MLKNFDTQVTDLITGKPISDGVTKEPLTVGTVAVTALLTSNEGDPKGDEKARRYRLASRLCHGGELDVTAEDLTLLKSVVGANYMPLVVGQFYEWADASYVPTLAAKPEENGKAERPEAACVSPGKRKA